METLQERFIKSSGAAVKVGNKFVVQSDTIDLQEARLKVKFCGQNENCGIALRAIDGKIRLSDGSWTKNILYIWYDSKLPTEDEHLIEARAVRIWNIYRIVHLSGISTVEYWTGNAGMIVDEIGNCERRYSCSTGPGNFEPVFFFELSWSPCIIKD